MRRCTATPRGLALTAAGKKHLAREHSKWTQFVQAIGRVMGPAPREAKG